MKSAISDQINETFIFEPYFIKFKKTWWFNRSIFEFQENGKMVRETPFPHPLSNKMVIVHNLLCNKKTIQSFRHPPLPASVVFLSSFKHTRLNIQPISFHQIPSKIISQ